MKMSAVSFNNQVKRDHTMRNLTLNIQPETP